jgi:hypothetical protein
MRGQPVDSWAIGTLQAPDRTGHRRLAPSPFADCMLYAYTCRGKEEHRACRCRFQVLQHHGRLRERWSHGLLGIFTKPNKGTSKQTDLFDKDKFDSDCHKYKLGKVYFFFGGTAMSAWAQQGRFFLPHFFFPSFRPYQSTIIIVKWAGLWSCGPRITYPYLSGVSILICTN